MKKILVSGSSGYLGRHVVNALKKMGSHDIIAVDFRQAADCEGVTFCPIDILAEAEDSQLYQRLGCPDVILHLAWQDGFNHNADSHMANMHKHLAFLRNMIESGCRNISVMGTMHEVGYHEGAIHAETPCNPLSMYGVAKNALRQSLLLYAQGKDVSLKWLRAYYITGDDTHNKSIFSKILEMAREGKSTFPFTSGVNQYDFLDVKLLAAQISKAAIQEKIAGIINVCSGVPVSLKDKVEAFIREKGLHIRPEYGVFPSRKYDSPAIWGDATLIQQIMEA